MFTNKLVRHCIEKRLHYDRTTSLIYSYKGGRFLKVKNPLFDFLISCNNFKLPIEHAKSYLKDISFPEKIHLGAAAFGYISEKNIGLCLTLSNSLEKIIVEFESLGFLFTNEEIGQVGDKTIDPISQIVIPTKDRLKSLDRCLSSFITQNKDKLPNLKYSVFDDSEKGDAKKTLEKFKGLSPEIYYGGPQEKKEFINQLVKLGAKESLLNFALFGFGPPISTYGGNRNAYLLHTVGEKCFSSDDDGLCETYTIKENNSNKISFTLQPNKEKYFTFSSREKALNNAIKSSENALTIHQEFLGNSIEHISASSLARKREIDMEEMDQSMLKNIFSKKGEVLITLNGLIGDSGMGALSNLTSTENKLDYKFSNEKDYIEYMSYREGIKVSPHIVIGKLGQIMCGFFGFDNRNFLPPFFPILRQEDKIFGLLLHHCFKDSYLAHLPFSLLHAPDEDRKNVSTETFLKIEHTPFPADIISDLIPQYNLNESELDPKAKLKIIGDILIDFSRWDKNKMKDYLSDLRLRLIYSSLRYFEDMLKKNLNSGKVLTNQLRKSINDNKAFLIESDPILYRSFISPSQTQKEGNYEDLIKTFSLFGELCIEWNGIIEKAKHLKEKGITLAQRI